MEEHARSTRRAWEVFLAWRCTPQKLQDVLSELESLPDENTHQEKCPSYLREYERSVFTKLWEIRNAKFVPTVMAILRILIANKATAQHVWTSMMNELNFSSVIIPLNVMEILCLCAEKGAQPTEEEFQFFLKGSSGIGRSENVTVVALKTVFVSCSMKPSTCHLQFLGDFYVIPQEILQIGRQLVHSVYRTMDDCLESKKLIVCFLFLSHEQGDILEQTSLQLEALFEDSYVVQWLRRSPMHLAAVFLDNEKSLKCLPQHTVEKYLNTRDLHGCTPLHLAHLHHNQPAVQFFKSQGAEQDVTDNFGLSPESLDSSYTTEDHPDVKYKKQCQSVLEAKRGVLAKMRPMLVLSQNAIEALTGELKVLFKRLLEGSQYRHARVVICGSLRENLKAGCLDEADIQLRLGGETLDDDDFKRARFSDDEFSDKGAEFSDGEFSDAEVPLDDEVSIAGVKGTSFSIKEESNEVLRAGVRLEEPYFMKQLSKYLIKKLGEISWEGIDLRPISVYGPWKLLRQGVTMSLDVVAIIECEKREVKRAKLLGQMLKGCRVHNVMKYCTLEPLTNKEVPFKETYFAYEWDITDSLSMGCRLAIVIAKALVQAYDLCKGDSLHVKMPISSYMIKTALFYLVAFNSGQLQFEKGYPWSVFQMALTNVEGNEVRAGASKLDYDPKATWTTDEDVDQHGEEGRAWACKIFTLIRWLAQQRDGHTEQGWRLNSFWDRRMPITILEGYGEAEYICDVCDCALNRLNPDTFYETDS